jgi:Ca-activated chloride channel homolog
MRLPPPTGALLLLAIVSGPKLGSQAVSGQPYNLHVAANEVVLTFHASDAGGLSINDLKLEELRILDNGRPQSRILAFHPLLNLPIRAGILMDTSQSMEQNRPADRAIAVRYAQNILEQKTDQAFVMSFSRRPNLLTPWTNTAAILTAALRRVGTRADLTAIFDTLYSACRYQFGAIDHATTGNFILLFSDGEDDASFLPLQQAVDACQKAHTAIYVFRGESGPGSTGSGLSTLAELARQTGGRIFHDDDSGKDIDEDLRLIDADLRNQYQLVYRPERLQSDGAFHTITLLPPDRVKNLLVRSGYYAPKP